MRVIVSSNRFKNWLLRAWVLLTVAGFLVEVFKHLLVALDLGRIVKFLGLSYEQNLPTWYSSSLLLLSAFHLGLIALATRQAGGRFVFHWWLLAAAFLYISLDETAEIHENASHWFNFGGFLYFGWVIPASIIVAVFGLSYVAFLFHLPGRTRNQFIVSGAIYVGGALGVEFLLGYWTDLEGSHNLVYGLIDLVEESMEILGVTLFLCSLIEYLARPSGRIAIRVRGAAVSDHRADGGPTKPDIEAGELEEAGISRL